MASGGEQKTVSLRTEVHSREDEELRETKDAFYEYMFRKATRDDGLSRTQVSTFEAVREELVSEEEVHENGDAANLGRRLAEIGDEVDSMYHTEIEEIVQMTGSPENAYAIFSEVVQNLFEWDETTGRAKITIGRLGALLAYAYHLCKHYIQHNAKVNLVVTFAGLVATWLFRFLIKAKFYEWLENMGGWGKLISNATSKWGNSLFLVIGITSLLIFGYNYLKNR